MPCQGACRQACGICGCLLCCWRLVGICQLVSCLCRGGSFSRPQSAMLAGQLACLTPSLCGLQLSWAGSNCLHLSWAGSSWGSNTDRHTAPTGGRRGPRRDGRRGRGQRRSRSCSTEARRGWVRGAGRQGSVVYGEGGEQGSVGAGEESSWAAWVQGRARRRAAWVLERNAAGQRGCWKRRGVGSREQGRARNRRQGRSAAGQGQSRGRHCERDRQRCGHRQQWAASWLPAHGAIRAADHPSPAIVTAGAAPVIVAAIPATLVVRAIPAAVATATIATAAAAGTIAAAVVIPCARRQGWIAMAHTQGSAWHGRSVFYRLTGLDPRARKRRPTTGRQE